jgi:hypothetical protein
MTASLPNVRSESVLGLRGAVYRDRTTNRGRVGFRSFKEALKDDYKGLWGCP